MTTPHGVPVHEIRAGMLGRIGLRELWDNRHLAVLLAWRNIRVRYKQTVLGVAWALLAPVAYTLIFMMFFQLAPIAPTGSLPLAPTVFTGMILWQFFSRALADAGTSLSANANLITKVYFPRLLLPISAILAALADLLVSSVLLAILLAMVTLVIGHNLARAFGLVGVLSIVRFRTVVSDTRDTAFVIFAVVIGMAVGSGFITLAMVSLPVIGAVAWSLSFWSRESGRGPTGNLVVRTAAGIDPEALVKTTLAKYLVLSRIASVGTAKQGAAIELTYSVRLRPELSVVALILDLQRVEGVQGVEWKEPSAD